jgi:hypothetical protein
MTCQYAYELVDGHIIVMSEDGKICLIDTGSHVSVGSPENILFAGARHTLTPTLLGKAAYELPGPIGVCIDVLVGVYILNHYDMLIDPVRQVLEFSDEELEVEGEVLSVQLLLGVPILEAGIGDKRIKVFFDTGAPVSYASEDVLNTYPRVGTAQDYYMTFGAFQTVIHRVPITLGSRVIDLDVGVLPPTLQSLLLAAGVEGILGTAILDYFVVAYQPRRKIIVLSKRQ